jgi:type II secretory pathway pseudopilin PulG
LLVSLVIVSLLAGTLGGLTLGVQQSWRYTSRLAVANQHARVALARMRRAIDAAYATATCPGVYVVTTTVNGYTFPDTLIVWKPNGTPLNSNGPPKINECVFFCPDPADPRQLLECTAPSDSRDLPWDQDLGTGPWATELATLKTAPSTKRVVLTNLLRTARVSDNDPNSARGVVRFERTLRPSAAEWSQFQSSSLTWANMSWPQCLKGKTTGLRQAWIRTELQLVPDAENSTLDVYGAKTVPYFGSASLMYQVQQ